MQQTPTTKQMLSSVATQSGTVKVAHPKHLYSQNTKKGAVVSSVEKSRPPTRIVTRSQRQTYLVDGMWDGLLCVDPLIVNHVRTIHKSSVHCTIFLKDDEGKASGEKTENWSRILSVKLEL